jgi:plastocyanin
MRSRVAVLAALIAIFLSAWPAQAATTNATIQGFAYHPEPITISVGDTVVWKNLDTATHTVTDTKGSFDSGDIGFNKTYSHTFNSAGTFTYHCTIHGFTGTLKVTASTTTKPATTTTKATGATTTKPGATTSTKAPTTSTSAKATSTAVPSTATPTIGNPTADTGTSTSTSQAGTLPKHHDSAVGPLLAAIAVVLIAAAAVGAYLYRRRRAGF